MRFMLVAILLLELAALSLPTHAQSSDSVIDQVPFTAVQIDRGFWAPRLATNRQVTVPYDFDKCDQTGRIANFARAGGLEDGPFQGIFYNDSDVFKVIEGASYALSLKPDPRLDAYLDDLIAKIAAAQEDDGYLYCARTLNDKNKGIGPERWSNLRVSHELYNVGHMYEAAVAHHQATGKRSFLDVAIKNADLVCKVFGPNEGQRIDVPGHEEIEIGLVRLYHATGDRKYLDQAKFFIDMRGREDLREIYGEYCQDHKPIVDQSEAVGHAVRAVYLYTGIADVAALTGDVAYTQAIDRIWHDIVARKLYITGGIGARHRGEAFGDAYELPNASAYNETCAAVANAMFNQRMFLLHGDAKYIDVLERTIYNGFLSGVSLSGDRFFYPNPLASRGDERHPWFNTSCCPVNVVRFIPSIPGYIYARREQSLYVNLFIDNQAEIELAGQPVTIAQRTSYPWDSRVKITVSPAEARQFTLNVRIPGWARSQPVPSELYRYADDSSSAWTIRVNGEPVTPDLVNGYAPIDRTWKPGDVVELDLPMSVRRVQASEQVEANRELIAIERGPIVYCAEGIDQISNEVQHLIVNDAADFTPEHQPKTLGGITVLRAQADETYINEQGEQQTRSAPITLIPYYAWAHRERTPMAVWLARDVEHARPLPAPTIANRSVATASFHNKSDSTSAMNDEIEPEFSNDQRIPRLTWWNHRGTEEWVQYNFDKPHEISSVEVYWFDDTGAGQCRVPQSWSLSARVDGKWQPVDAHGEFGVEQNKYNRVEFDPVTADALRLNVKLRDKFSGGILEWKVN